MRGYKLNDLQLHDLRNMEMAKNRFFNPIESTAGDFYIMEEEMNALVEKGWDRITPYEQFEPKALPPIE